MSIIPLHLQRQFEQRWATRISAMVVPSAPKNVGSKNSPVNVAPCSTRAKERPPGRDGGFPYAVLLRGLSGLAYCFFRQRPTVELVPHLALSAAPPLGQKPTPASHSIRSWSHQPALHEHPPRLGRLDPARGGALLLGQRGQPRPASVLGTFAEHSRGGSSETTCPGVTLPRPAAVTPPRAAGAD